MKKAVFRIYEKIVWKSCVADLRSRFRYIVTPLNFLNPKFQLSRCCLLDLVGNLEGRFCRAWVNKLFTCNIRHIYMFDWLYMYKSFISHLGGNIKDTDQIVRECRLIHIKLKHSIFSRLPPSSTRRSLCGDASLRTMHNEI